MWPKMMARTAVGKMKNKQPQMRLAMARPLVSAGFDVGAGEEDAYWRAAGGSSVDCGGVGGAAEEATDPIGFPHVAQNIVESEVV